MSDRIPGGSLAKLLAWRAAENPDAGFVFVEDDGPWTYGQLAAAASRIATQLTVTPGDRVIVRVGNDERFLPALCAVWLRAAAVVPMHPAAPAAEVTRVVEALDVSAVIADPDDPCRIEVAVPVTPFPRIPLTTPVASEEVGVPGPSSSDARQGVGSQPALVLLTSGTTGAPKGVVLTHDNAWSNVRATVSAFRSDTTPTPLAAEDKPPNLIANPLSHTAGVVRLIFALYVGRRVVLLRKFDGRTTKRLLDRHGIDALTLNPTMLRILLDALEPGADLGRVRYVGSGTAPLPPALREEFEARFKVPVLQAYGQTEAFGGITVESVKDVLAGRRRPGSVGRALPGVELRIVCADGSAAAPGEQGEIQARSRSCTAGYLGAEPGAGPLDADGWLRTGDLGHLDTDGYLYITGRLKNTIICGGFNVIPEEVEAALEEDPRVREAVVVPLPDDKLGEIPVAVVEADATPADVLAAVAPRLAPYKRPRQVFVVTQLPRVPNGKVDRPAAQAMAKGAASTL
ncbi:MAG TPA: class I adenylate-forming enzyme family protein [Sporichthyaceae bacterium]